MNMVSPGKPVNMVSTVAIPFATSVNTALYCKSNGKHRELVPYLDHTPQYQASKIKMFCV